MDCKRDNLGKNFGTKVQSGRRIELENGHSTNDLQLGKHIDHDNFGLFGTCACFRLKYVRRMHMGFGYEVVMFIRIVLVIFVLVCEMCGIFV